MKKLLFISILAIFSLTAASETITFNVGTGNWNVAGNWDLNRLPTVADEVIIATGNHCTIQSTTTAYVLSVVVQPNATLTVEGALTLAAGATTQCGTTSIYYEVSSATGKIWLDRNLGASQVATASDDAAAYGDLYQWGRSNEDHQCRDSENYEGPVANPNTGNDWDGHFVTSADGPYDWLDPQDESLWQGVSGTNNPCPNGYRLPTEAEWTAEISTWDSQDDAGAFASVLKLTIAGQRGTDGGVTTTGEGYYWSSSLGSNDRSVNLFFDDKSVQPERNEFRAFGCSVRCIKD